MLRTLAPVLLLATAAAQTPPPADLTFAFWNVENLFDATDDPANAGDDEYLPAKDWTEARYRTKLDRLAEVILAASPHVLGLAEVENRRVLEDLLQHPSLAPLELQIVHRDSADGRGIDLALLYRAPFSLAGGDAAVRLHPVERPNAPASRGVLEVPLTAHGQPLLVLVNHWPSRGSDKDGSFRAVAAQVCRRIIDEALAQGTSQGRDADVLLVGDLNDDPYDRSVREVLNAARSKHAVLERQKDTPLWNASWALFAEPDVGTLYYDRDWNWNVFDQAIMSRGMLREPGFRFVDGSLRVHATAAMRDHYGRPKRFRRARDSWVEGYSDHFPIVGRLVVTPSGG